MTKFQRSLCAYTFAITTACFSFIPDEAFSWVKMLSADYWNCTINKVILLIVVGIMTCVYMVLRRCMRKKLTIRGHNYIITIERGDLFKQNGCKKVIPFDELFTTDVGEAVHQIKPTSLCGQFLSRHHPDVQDLLLRSGIKTARKRSAYDGKACYEPGVLLPYYDFLLMAFSKLDSDGRAVMSRENYLSCLTILWKEIDKYYAQTDVAIPIFGAGVTRFDGGMLTAQQLVDIIILSYKLSPHKIKLPNVLHIVYKDDKNFSLNKIGESL